MDWQPARIRIVHRDVDGFSDFSMDGKVIRVRKSNHRTAKGHECGGEILEWHPEDVEKLLPHLKGRIVTVCEHEVLTD